MRLFIGNSKENDVQSDERGGKENFKNVTKNNANANDDSN